MPLQSSNSRNAKRRKRFIGSSGLHISRVKQQEMCCTLIPTCKGTLRRKGFLTTRDTAIQTQKEFGFVEVFFTKTMKRNLLKKGLLLLFDVVSV
jgi:hypothetical protein